MIHPTIHLNGTGADGLRELYCNASDALNDAYMALRKANPNGRDYYVQSPDALKRAIREHDRRMARVDEVKAEIDALAMGLDDCPQGGTP